MTRKPVASDEERRFGGLFAYHLAAGTRPDSAGGEPWTDAAFAMELQSTQAGDSSAAPRSVSNWRKGTVLPAEIEPILRALFGPEPGPRHAEARATLSGAHIAARRARNIRILRDASPVPDGRWVETKGGQLDLDRSVTWSDEQAAADPRQRQLQQAILPLAQELSGRARRYGSSMTWDRLPLAAALLRDIIASAPTEIPGRLGELYAATLQLGGFLETDARLGPQSRESGRALDAVTQAMLGTVVMMVAPWARRYPTITGWDDAAGARPTTTKLLRPAFAFIRIAEEQALIPPRAAAEVVMVGYAAAAPGFPAAKARGRAFRLARSLAICAANAFGAVQVNRTGAAPAPHSVLVRRAIATLIAAEPQVAAIAATLPADMARAVLELAKEARARGPGPESVPGHIESRAEEMILARQTPPAAWTPHIRSLNFEKRTLTDLTPLAGLAALQSLGLWHTQVSDLTPLARLTALQYLGLLCTQVSDLTPLAGLTALQNLRLDGTQVSDLAPLAGLTALQYLGLGATRVSDLAPLAGLTALQSLSLNGTQVTDLAPLAGLTALRNLSLYRTQVTDLAPLAGLTALRRLDLLDTPARNWQVLDHLDGLTIIRRRRATRRRPRTAHPNPCG